MNGSEIVKEALAGLGLLYAACSFTGNALVMYSKKPKYIELGKSLQKVSAQIAEVKEELQSVRESVSDHESR